MSKVKAAASPSGGDCFSPKRRSEIMRKIPGVNTKPELLVRSLLHRAGFRFRLHRRDLPGTPDVVIPKYRTVINVNGCFWHGHNCKDGHRPKSNPGYWNDKLDRNIVRDQRVAKQLATLGWKLMVVWGCEVRDTGRLLERFVKELRITA